MDMRYYIAFDKRVTEKKNTHGALGSEVAAALEDRLGVAAQVSVAPHAPQDRINATRKHRESRGTGRGGAGLGGGEGGGGSGGGGCCGWCGAGQLVQWGRSMTHHLRPQLHHDGTVKFKDQQC